MPRRPEQEVRCRYYQEVGISLLGYELVFSGMEVSSGQLAEGLDGLTGSSFGVGQREDFRRKVTPVADFPERFEDGGHFGMTKADGLSVGVCKMDVSHL